MRLARADKSLLTDWWFTVDRVTLAAGLLLLLLGVVMLLSASPSVAIRRDLPPFHFVQRQLIFALFGAGVIIATSLLDPANIRRLALALFSVSLVSMVLVLLIGPEINGAQRWLRLGGLSFQPSEILKPAFIILTGWAFAEGQVRRDVPALSIAIGFYVLAALLLILQPDFGQTLLLTATWVGMFFLAGLAWGWMLAFITAGFGALVLAYQLLPHVRQRIDYFFDPSGENYQIGRALEVFQKAGWFGRGPGEGTLNDQFLPDAHNDFIFAAIADEFGIIACLILLAIYGVIVFRALQRVRRAKDSFVRITVAGLILLFGMQVAINMSVNLGLVPAKGMTLPFISYGGSSLLGCSVLLGFVLALTRRMPISDQVLQTR